MLIIRRLFFSGLFKTLFECSLLIRPAHINIYALRWGVCEKITLYVHNAENFARDGRSVDGKCVRGKLKRKSSVATLFLRVRIWKAIKAVLNCKILRVNITFFVKGFFIGRCALRNFCVDFY